MKRSAGSESHVTLKIPRPLYEQLKQVIEGSGFHSVTEFAVYVLRDLVSHHGASALRARPRVDHEPPSVEANGEPLSPDEIAAIRTRLQSLGYL
ncbi:hypothetical protein BH18ACT15_BH18ACT15_01500 [soil metagenome]